MTEKHDHDLSVAAHLIEEGVPIFRARPADDAHGGHHGTGYWLPKHWQHTQPDRKVLESWSPGDALCAVMGHTIDLIDIDPRSGGEESLERLKRLGLPMTYGRTSTPSGGQHLFIAALGVRSLDRLLPGLDLKAGTNGAGHGFAFIPPTSKLSKTTGVMVPYTWDRDPDLTMLTLVGGDATGRPLAELVNKRHGSADPIGNGNGATGYSGPPFEKLSLDEQQLASASQESQLKFWREKLNEAQDWPEGQTDEKGRGWEGMCTAAAFVVALQATCPWTPLTASQAQETYDELLPPAMAADVKCRGKIVPIDKAASYPAADPWWVNVLPPAMIGKTPTDPETLPDIPTDLMDSSMAEWILLKGLKARWCHVGSLGWHWWDGVAWVRRTDDALRDEVRRCMRRLAYKVMDRFAGDQTMLKRYLAFNTASKINIMSGLMRGVVQPDLSQFDAHPDLLTVGNGVLDLRNGSVNDPDPKLYLTRRTATPYRPDARHEDWDQVLTALDPEVADWMQIRIGQAITGYPTSDDVLPICQGGGSNGKTTLLAALQSALGEHMVFVPDQVLRVSNKGEHPTETMVLLGARLAVIDETPEMATLHTARLKQVIGSEKITARPVFKDTVTWAPTHSLFVMTNYIPQVVETDRGTWRRLALVRFTKTFKQDDAFRARLSAADDSFRAAVLAWVVQGAQRWYENGRVIPPPPEQVRKDTAEWRQSHDPVMGYLRENIVFDANACIWSRDLLDDMAEWLKSNRYKPWGDRLMSSRLMGHEVIQQQSPAIYRRQSKGEPEGLVRRMDSFTPLVSQPQIWFGMRFRNKGDDE